MSKPSILWQSHLKNSDVLDDIEAKARAYLLKYLDIEGLMADIKAVALGNAIISEAIAGRLIDLFRQVNEPNDNSVTATLSIREIEVLRLVAGGASSISVRRPSKPTCATSWTSCRSKTAPRLWLRPSATACWNVTRSTGNLRITPPSCQ